MTATDTQGQLRGIESAIEAVMLRQKAWANRTDLLTGDGERLRHTTDALMAGLLDSSIERALRQGAGGELERIPSFRSSSGLALNFLAPWRDRPTDLAAVLKARGSSPHVGFEVRMPTGLKGTPPHLDVVLDTTAEALAIECKFLEMYRRAKNTFSPAYFRSGLWQGLDACRALARRVADGEEHFEWLGAAQLLKHSLGLASNRERYRLLLVWYRLDHPISEAIEKEIERFQAVVARDLEFEAITYQRLVSHLREFSEPRPGYFGYLSERYGLGPE